MAVDSRNPELTQIVMNSYLTKLVESPIGPGGTFGLARFPPPAYSPTARSIARPRRDSQVLTAHGRDAERTEFRRTPSTGDRSTSAEIPSFSARGRIMERLNRLACGWLTAALLLIAPAVLRADDSPRRELSEVVLKSLDTKLQVDGRMVDTRGEYLHYRVEQVNGDRLWIVAEPGTRGWVRRQDVVPAEQAIQYFSSLLARNPRSAQACRMRGLAHFDAEECRRAIRDASMAIRLDPSFAPAYVDRAFFKLEKLDAKGAMDDAQKAIRLDPRSARAYLCRANVWHTREEYKQALLDFDEAIRLDPTSAIVRVDRARSASESGDDDRAIADTTEAIRLDPNLTSAYIQRSLCWRNKKEPGRALADANQAIAVDSKSYGAYIARAAVRFDSADLDQALADCDQAIRLESHQTAAHSIRAAVLAKKGTSGPQSANGYSTHHRSRSPSTEASLPANDKRGDGIAAIIDNGSFSPG